jgi:hypothetical protein
VLPVDDVVKLTASGIEAGDVAAAGTAEEVVIV